MDTLAWSWLLACGGPKDSAVGYKLHQLQQHSPPCPRNTISAIQASRLPWFEKDTADTRLQQQSPHQFAVSAIQA